MGRMRRDRKLKRELEEFIVTALEDAVTRLVAEIPPAVAAIQAGQAPPADETSATLAINTAADQLHAALNPTTGTQPPAATPETPVLASDAPPESGALTAPS